MSKKPENTHSNTEQAFLQPTKRKLRYVKRTYTKHRNEFQETIPLGTLVWDVLRIILAVAVISSIIITLTGLTTPFVAVSSGSMEPNLLVGDLVITTSPDGSPPLAGTDSIETSKNTSTTSFNNQGSVIVFHANHLEVPVIHRAHYHTEKSENWVENVDQDKLPEHATCQNIETCPAPQTGYITIGDNNPYYDQVREYDIVTEHDIIGVAEYRIPYLGRLSIGIDKLKQF